MEVLGWRIEKGLLIMSRGSEIFGDLLGRDQNFSISPYKRCISFFGRGCPKNLPLLLQFQTIFFTTKRHSQKIHTPQFHIIFFQTYQLKDFQKKKKKWVFHIH